MSQFFTGEYGGAAFELFGTPHIIALMIVALINVALLAVGQRLWPRWRKIVRTTLATVLIVNEALWLLWLWTTGQASIQTALPLHLCSILVFTSAILLVNRNHGLYEFVYLLGIAGASQALLTPLFGAYGFPHFRFFQGIISHGSIVTAAIYMTAVEGYRPTLQSIKRILIRGNIYAVFVGIVNALLGSNYVFIAHKPATASLLDVLPPWPLYLPILEAIALVMIGLLYLPFAITDLKAKQAMPDAAALT